MNKCLVIPDSYKGTLSAIDVCTTMKSCIGAKFPGCEVITSPIADGGEGTVDCFLHIWPDGEKITVKVSGPFNEPIDSFYGKFGDVAVVELAAAAGLGLCKNLDALNTTTYGVGELIKDAVEKGCTKVILGLGGSCTNDGGAGMAAALGTRFYNDKGEAFVPVGKNLGKVVRIDNSETVELLKGVEVRAMCDIDNPMIGPNGATYVFGPQKGADEDDLKILEENMVSFGKVLSQYMDEDISNKERTGAAGAASGGAYVFLNASLERGIDVVLDLIDFENIVSECDLILTGEGKLDSQSLGGKAVIGISERAKKLDVPVIAVVGSVDEDLPDLTGKGITKVYPTSNSGLPEGLEGEELRTFCMDQLEQTMEKVLDDME